MILAVFFLKRCHWDTSLILDVFLIAMLLYVGFFSFSIGFLGCVDSITVSASWNFDMPTMTVHYCIEMCRGLRSYTLALVLGTLCHCKTPEPAFFVAVQASSAGNCDTPCPGNSMQICGGSQHFSVYYAGTSSFLWFLWTMYDYRICVDLCFSVYFKGQFQ